MNTKIITALVIGIALVGLIGTGLVSGNNVLTEPPTVTKTVDPTEIYVDGTDCAGLNEETTLTITVIGAGGIGFSPLDVMLIIDRSGSMSGTPLADAKSAAKTFVDLINDTTDRSGLASFASTARLDEGLTFDKNAVKSAIGGLSAGGMTAMGDGIHVANTEIINNGRPDAFKVEILLSDGNSNQGSNPITRANEAAAAGIRIYTIGLGSANAAVMQEIADITGGKYYYAPTSSQLEEIYKDILKDIGWSTMPHDVDVVEVTQDEIVVIPGSCSLTPDVVSGNTIIWNDIGDGPMGADKTVTITCTVKSTEVGKDMPVQVYGLAVVKYKDSKGVPAGSVDIPQAYLTQIDLWIGTNKELDKLIKKVDNAPMSNIIKNRLIDKLEYAKELKENAHKEYLAGNVEVAKKKLGVAKNQVESFERMVKITRRIESADKKAFLKESALIKEKIDCLIEKIQIDG